jgi:hypothetical protein
MYPVGILERKKYLEENVIDGKKDNVKTIRRRV